MFEFLTNGNKLTFYTTITGLTALLGFSLGGFVYWHKPHTPLKISWVIFSCTVSFWSLGYFISLLAINYSTSILFSRLSHACGSFIPITFLYFVLILLRQAEKKKRLLFWGYVFSAFMFLCSLTPLVVRDILPKRGIPYYPDWGIFYPLYTANYLVFIGYSYFLMVRAISYLKGLEQRRVIYLFAASILGFSGGISLFLLVFNIQLPPYGSTLICLYPIIMSYSIVKHRLMDIEVIIKKTLVFAGLFSFIFGLFAFFSFILTDILQQGVTPSMRWLLFAAATAVIALTVRRMELFLVNLTDRFLFQKKYNYHKLLRENSKQISVIQSLDEMAKQVVAFLITQGRIRNAGIFVQSYDQRRFELKYPLGYGGKTKRPSLSLEAEHPLVQLLLESKTPLVLEDIAKEPARGDKRKGWNMPEVNLDEVLRIMRQLNAEVIIPSFLGSPSNGQGKSNSDSYRLKTMLVLGPKKSDEEYTDEDLDVFFTIAQDSAIAAENARLLDLILKERESRLKAESEAKMVAYAKSIGHETKNALAGLYDPARFLTQYAPEDFMKIYDRFLKEKVPEGIEKRFLEIIEKMKKQGDKVFAKADEIRIITKTAEGTLSSSEEEFDEINFKVLWDSAKASAKGGLCRFIRECPDRFFPYGNVVLLQRVFVNLINNAMEAMPNHHDKELEIIVHGEYRVVDGKKVTYFEFRDNGPGIPAEIQDKIFQQGFSTKPKPKSTDIEASGHGQGLWICKQNIEEVHAGRIWIESEAGKGVAFKFWLPLKEGEPGFQNL